ncbi:copper chaperone PCu(A)C [Uliginosibacterium sp. H3]|uniref:Copper chaperone PCu(A)C n=1 Tax=Uliginosibacterium silvisoli TaxID=3114758 RepID=A0ABU6K5E0_9RHOO|nr:copper chaperone PCu(A)C [Uliginosibacterium sp. H3]
MSLHRYLTLACLVLLSFSASAHDYTLGSIKIGHPWTRATTPGAQTGGGYLKLDNGGAADRLVSVSSNVSEQAEIHTMSMEGDVMRMQKLDKGVELPAGKTVEFKPGGLHIMLLGLKAPLKEGAKFPLTLKFEKAGEITVDVKVESLTGAPAAGAEHKH